MEKGFWLVVLDDLSATVSFINQTSGKYKAVAIGQSQDWLATNPDTIVKAVDASLSAAAESANISEADEPSVAAFIIPPFWVGPDGKISANYLKLVESICKELSLKPLGFIGNDEAVTEAANSADSFPASFIFVYLNRQILTLSLVYLGKVKSRISRIVSGVFNPKIIEDILVEIQSESTLPPQIILAGNIDDDTVSQIKNYPWIGKKNIETFLHFPSVAVYGLEQLTNIYCQVISHQFSDSAPIDNPMPHVDEVDEVEVDEIETEVEDNTPTDLSQDFQEVLSSDLGFGVTDPAPIAESPIVSEEFDVVPQPEPQKPEKIKKSFVLPKFQPPKFKLPQIRLPKINLNSFALLFPIIIVLLLSGIVVFSKATVVLKLTPYNFSQTSDIDLNQVASKKTFDINSSASIKSTGQKTVGTIAKGEIVIYNKQDKLVTVPKNAALVSDNNLKFELSSLAQVAASATNFDTGTITMGQTKILVSAADIGSEYNLPKDAKLTFKDSAYSPLVAKTNQVFTGGTKKIASAVSAEDKAALEQKIKSEVTSSIDSRLNQDVKSISDAIDETVDIKRNRIEFNREVGEEADEVSATSNNTVSVFYFTTDQKTKIINSLLSSSPGFSDATIEPSSFKFSFVPSSSDKSKGKLTIAGTGVPKVNKTAIQKSLSGKNQKNAQQIIRKVAPRTYNYQITTNFNFLSSFNPLPFISKNITIESK